MMGAALDALGRVLVLVGALLMLLAAVGVLRFPDPLSRMHAASKAGTLGLVVVCAGAAILLEGWGAVTKLALVAILQFLTNPVAGHLLGRSIYAGQGVEEG